MAFLTIKNLTVRFGGVSALNGLDMDVEQGEFVGLMGPNGAGKTSLFNVMTGLYKASAGYIKVGGRAITGLPPHVIYGLGVSRTFQASRLSLELTLFDNVVLGRYKSLHKSLLFNVLRRKHFYREFDDAVSDVRDAVNIFNEHLADKLWSTVGALSMIDRRRIEVCRALIAKPRLLLLDEPSAGMTSEETNEFMGEMTTIKRMFPQLTVLLIEHNLSVMKNNVERCVVMNYGEKIADGRYDEVVADPGVRVAYFGGSVDE